MRLETENLRRVAEAILVRNRFLNHAIIALFFVMTILPTHAAEQIVTPPDTNSWVTVENAIVDGNETTLFFTTRPDIRDPEARNPCALNYYTARLSPGLPEAAVQDVAKGVCGGVYQKSRLLENGEAIIIVHDRVERWRDGKKISELLLAEQDVTRKLGVTADEYGTQNYDISPGGDLVFGVFPGGMSYDRKEYANTPFVMLGTDSKATKRWETRFTGPAYGQSAPVRAGLAGDAMVSNAFRMGDVSALYHVSAGGKLSEIAVTEGAPAEAVHYVPREGGGFDALVYRKGKPGQHDLFRIGPDGQLESSQSLGSHLVDYGLERSFDFYLEGDQLVLLSKALVTQKAVGNGRKKMGQIIVSWVDLGTGMPDPRLIPLDERYLEAALNSGDEGRQYLAGHPDSDPVMLTTLGGEPLAVSVGWIAKRQVIRLHEANRELPAFTEIYDKNRGRTAVQKAPQQPPPSAEDVQSQVMDAMAQAQQELANDPNISPEMREQMMAMMQQLGGAEGLAALNSISGLQAQSAEADKAVLEVGPDQRGRVEYRDESGQPVSLSVVHRMSGVELQRNEYPDGVVDESIDFRQFQMPLDQLAVILRNSEEQVVRELAPALRQ